MYPRVEYEMTEADLVELLDACKPVPCIQIGGYTPSRQENANRAWDALGRKMGFDSNTVRPIDGKSNRFFTAVPSETAKQKAERLEKQRKEEHEDRIASLKEQILDLQHQLEEMSKD